MLRRNLFPILCFAIFAMAAQVAAAQSTPAQIIAPTPPMGWNSWDSYGLTIDEVDYRANTTVLAGLRKLGWQYSVIDEGWYMQDPFADTVEARKYVWDANGILIPVVSRFPPPQTTPVSSRLPIGFIRRASIRHSYRAWHPPPGRER